MAEDEGGLGQIQADIVKLQLWAKTWQMSFNYDKCKVMHFGKEEQNTLKLGGLGERQHRIEQSLVVRDLVTLMVYRVCSKMG